MQLKKIDALQPKALQAARTRGAQMFGLAVLLPLIGSGAIEARFGCDDQPVRIGVQRLGNDLFAHTGSIRVRGIDEINSQLYRSSQHPHRFFPVLGLSPNSLSRDPHRAESEPVDVEVCCNLELAAQGCRKRSQFLFRQYAVHFFSI
jgi:hypothetical protein